MSEFELVSVVMPCRNEVRSIEKAVRAVLDSYYPNLELIVVDGMSEDGTRDVLHRLQQEDPRVRLVNNPMKLTPQAFNLGVRAAKGTILQRVDSRNIVDPNYISILVEKLQTRPDVG